MGDKVLTTISGVYLPGRIGLLLAGTAVAPANGDDPDGDVRYHDHKRREGEK